MLGPVVASDRGELHRSEKEEQDGQDQELGQESEDAAKGASSLPNSMRRTSQRPASEAPKKTRTQKEPTTCKRSRHQKKNERIMGQREMRSTVGFLGFQIFEGSTRTWISPFGGTPRSCSSGRRGQGRPSGPCRRRPGAPSYPALRRLSPKRSSIVVPKNKRLAPRGFWARAAAGRIAEDDQAPRRFRERVERRSADGHNM